MYYKIPSSVSLARTPKGVKVKVGRGKVLDWAKKAGSSLRDFMQRTKVGTKLGRQFAEYIPLPQGRDVADILLTAAEQEGYGRRRRRGSRKMKRGSGVRLAGAGPTLAGAGSNSAFAKKIESQIRRQVKGQIGRYL